MGNASDPPAEDRPLFDPRTTPLPRRTMLLVMGAGAVAATGGLGALLAGCQGPPVTVSIDLDLTELVVGTPTEIPFTMTTGSGSTVTGSTWLVMQRSGNLIAYDPRCTHALCAYDWSAELGRFGCYCHEGRFALDGSVLSGPPPRALDRFPIRETPTGIEIDVPSNFVEPQESLG